jgi:hypothetical protein
MKAALKRYARPLLGVLISSLLLWQLFAHIDLDKLRATLLTAKALPIALGLCAVVAAFGLRTLRWHAMVAHFTPSVRLPATATAFLSSFALNNTLPLRAGDLARTFMYAKELQTPPATLAATLLIERLLDAATLALLFCLGLWWIPAEKIPPTWMAWVHQAGAIFTVLALVGLAALFLLPKIVMWALQHFEHTSKGAKLKAVLLQFGSAFGLLRSPVLVFKLLSLSLLSWAMEGCVFLAVAHALGMVLPGYAPWFALSTATLATLIPGTPGHLGTFDYFAVLGFSLYGINRTDGASMALLIHLLLWLPVTVVGGALLLRRQGAGTLEKIHQLEKEHA